MEEGAVLVDESEAHAMLMTGLRDGEANAAGSTGYQGCVSGGEYWVRGHDDCGGVIGCNKMAFFQPMVGVVECLEGGAIDVTSFISRISSEGIG